MRLSGYAPFLSLGLLLFLGGCEPVSSGFREKCVSTRWSGPGVSGRRTLEKVNRDYEGRITFCACMDREAKSRMSHRTYSRFMRSVAKENLGRGWLADGIQPFLIRKPFSARRVEHGYVEVNKWFAEGTKVCKARQAEDMAALSGK